MSRMLCKRTLLRKVQNPLFTVVFVLIAVFLITDSGIAVGVGMAIASVCLSVCLFVCLSALTGNGLSYQHHTWYTYTL